MAENKFLASVADVKLYDGDNNLILNGKTLLDSSITQSMQSSAIHGGKGSQKLYEFNYQKELAISISDATFNLAFLSAQNGSKVLRELGDYFATEHVQLDATGAGQLQGTPIGNIHVENANGSFSQITPVGSDFVHPTLKDVEVEVSYTRKEMMDTLVISAKDFPKSLKLVLNADINTNEGKVEEMQILVPKFKPDGAMELAMSHDGVSNTPLAGTTIADNKGNYAYISFKHVDNSTIPFIDIAAAPNNVQLEKAVVGDSQKVTLYGVRGGVYGLANLDNTEATFATDDADVATVDADGVITIASTATVGESTFITVTHGTAEDIIRVTIV